MLMLYSVAHVILGCDRCSACIYMVVDVLGDIRSLIWKLLTVELFSVCEFFMFSDSLVLIFISTVHIFFSSKTYVCPHLRSTEMAIWLDRTATAHDSTDK